jgi:hypothetical protein
MRNQVIRNAETVLHAAGPMENYVETTQVTVHQILEEFKSLKDAFDWQLTAQERIQGTLKNDAERHVFDPITAIVFFRTGKYFPEGQSGAGARSLGLSFLDSTEFVAACNYGFMTGTGPGALRYELMDAALAKSAMMVGALVSH